VGADNSGVYFTADDRGSRNVTSPRRAVACAQLTRATHMLSLSSVSRGGAPSAQRARTSPATSSARPAPRQPHRLTSVNDDILAGVRLGEVEELWYERADGTRVQGWVVKPPDFDPAAATR
jgi:dipeptidyl aminopeptidase/acylaminoacyl peptidase